MPNGRPTIYTQELADEICADLVVGKSLRTVCASDDRPAISTIFLWFRTQPGFREQYEKAKEECSDMLVEDMLDIADNVKGDTQRDRLRVDTRKWTASKLKAKKYGEKLDMTSNGQVLGVIAYPVKSDGTNTLGTNEEADGGLAS